VSAAGVVQHGKASSHAKGDSPNGRGSCGSVLHNFTFVILSLVKLLLTIFSQYDGASF
jgi:hypothetical protein